VAYWQRSVHPDEPQSVESLFLMLEKLPFDHPLMKRIRSLVSRKVGAISNERRHKEAERRKRK